MSSDIDIFGDFPIGKSVSWSEKYICNFWNTV